ncbi:MAG TPA: hypothetical protein PLD02_05820, partial [Saprospiraceae bacterium]|nr:hypothetical protein [Saprospiraceae bacterium]
LAIKNKNFKQKENYHQTHSQVWAILKNVKELKQLFHKNKFLKNLNVNLIKNILIITFTDFILFYLFISNIAILK